MAILVCDRWLTRAALMAVVGGTATLAAQSPPPFRMSMPEYEDRARGAWTAQIIGALMGFQFEHKPASTAWVDQYPRKYDSAPVDDDYYYELVALRAFEKNGTKLTAEQLGEQWKENSAGSWGSSEQTRLLLARGIQAPDTGHPRYNRLWFTIGPQFSSDIYGMIAPGLPNVAGRLARNLGAINGYAEGVDGAVFVAGMISLAFYETDPKTIVRRAARLIHPSSPYRQCLDLVIALGDKGRSAKEVFQAVEDRWHIEYPATNNAVANGGIVAASVWFGEGDLLKTLNLAFGAADFTDADCNAANAGSVVGAMRGMNGLPGHLVAPLHDRISGSEMGGVKLTPPVEEKISAVASRIAAVGKKILTENGAKWEGETFTVTRLAVRTQEAQRFELADLMQYWNKEWTLDRAGFGGAGGGLAGVRGITYLDGEVLSTWPRDEVRGVVLRRKAKLGDNPKLALEVGADGGRAWQLEVYANNTRLVSKLIEGGEENEPRRWEKIEADLGAMRGQEVELRLYQRVLVRNKTAGNAYWRKVELR